MISICVTFCNQMTVGLLSLIGAVESILLALFGEIKVTLLVLINSINSMLNQFRLKSSKRKKEKEKKGGAAKRRTGQPTGEKDALEARHRSHWSAAGCRMKAEPISFNPASFHPLPPVGGCRFSFRAETASWYRQWFASCLRQQSNGQRLDCNTSFAYHLHASRAEAIRKSPAVCPSAADFEFSRLVRRHHRFIV